MKRLVALVLLLGLLLVADRAAASFAARAVAEQAQAQAALPAPPEVDVRGFPFLTQALSGRYDEVVVTAADVPAGELRIARFEAELRGVQVPLSDALSGDVSAVPVDGVRARALVAYGELTRQAGSRRLTVAPAGDRVRVTGQVEVLGRTLSAAAVSRVEVDGGDLVVTAEEYEVGNEAADALLTRALGDRLDLRIPVRGLPYGLEVTGVQVEPQGVTVLSGAGRTVLGRT